MNDLSIFTLLIMGLGGSVLIPTALILAFRHNYRGYKTAIKGSKKTLKKDLVIYLGLLWAIVFALLFL